MQKQDLCKNQWYMKQCGVDEKIPAVIPGSVYGDYLRNGKMEDPFWKDNEDAACRLMENDFEYETVFTVSPDLMREERILLHFDGLDTIADIFLNGTLLGHTENMHREWEYEITDLLRKSDENRKECLLRVCFHSPIRYIREKRSFDPYANGGDSMPGFDTIRKAHCMFGWDWGAHLPDAGIWRPVYLLGYSTARITSIQILQNHMGKEGVNPEEEHKVRKVELTIRPEIKSSRKNIEKYLLTRIIRITDPDGNIVVESESSYKDEEKLIITDPKLWWPNGYGEQNLYTMEYQILRNETEIDCWKKKIGLRTITVNRNALEIGGEEFAVTVNGIRIFSMGADYIPEDHLFGRITPETTRTLLEKAVWANHNCIRVWGGGYYPDDWFYEICDELGLIVWQDFMFACSYYELTDEFEKNIIPEFRENLKRIRHHACLGILSGNNEVEDMKNWDGVNASARQLKDYIILFERIIDRIVEELAPQTFYWPSSPSSGGGFENPQNPEVGDQHYWEVWHGNKPFSEYRKYLFRYCSEFGFQSFPSEKTIETFTDDPRDKNIFSYIMERHQRNASANGKIMNYMQQTYRYPYDFSSLIYASQLLQADAIRYGVEHFRRNRGVCMGAVVWQLNDCWPVASWSSIDYCGRLKALHYYEKRFFAPVMISCEEEGMVNAEKNINSCPGDFRKSIRLAVSNESRKDENLHVIWSLRRNDASVIRKEIIPVSVKALSSRWLEKIDLPEADAFTEYVSYEVRRNPAGGEQSEEAEESAEEKLSPVEKDPAAVLSSGTVIFSYPKYFHYLDPRLSVSTDGQTITVSASAYAKSVEIQNKNEDLILSDNYFDMNAGTRTLKVLSGETTGLKVRSVFDIG